MTEGPLLQSHKDRSIEQIIMDVLAKGGGVKVRCYQEQRAIEVCVRDAHFKEYCARIPEIEWRSMRVPAVVLQRELNECERRVYG